MPLYKILILLFCCALAYFLQSHVYLHKDVAYILYTAQQMFMGQTYTHDFFEPNPPMIFFLQMPAIILAKYTSLNLVMAFRIYMITLSVLSIICCRFLLTKLFNKNTFLINLMLFTLVYVLLFLPAHQFGQREHFLLILVFPYLFTAVLRLKNEPINPLLAFLVGMFAGIGFSIKPHFLPTLILIELYFIYKNRSIFGWIRIETLCIASILFAYLGMTLWLYPQYFHTVLPLWTPFYHAIRHSWQEVLLDADVSFCIGAIIFYFVCRKKNQYQILCHILMLAIAGFFISYLIPQANWYYHLIPALGVSFMLMTLTLEQFLQSIKFSKKRILDIGTKFTMIAAIVFIPIALQAAFMTVYMRHYHQENSWKKISAFLKKQDTYASFDFYSLQHNYISLALYFNIQYTGPFPFTMWEYNLFLLKYKPSKEVIVYQKEKVPYIINILANSLKQKKPHFVIVDTNDTTYYLGMNIHYLEQFLQNKNFRDAWKHYHYLTTIDKYQIYRLH